MCIKLDIENEGYNLWKQAAKGYASEKRFKTTGVAYWSFKHVRLVRSIPNYLCRKLYRNIK
jgi:hypothetical protein